MPVRAGEPGVPAVWLTVLWCAFHVIKSSSNPLPGRAVDKLGPRRWIFLGWFVSAVVYLAYAPATTAWEGWVFLLAPGLVIGRIEPTGRTLVANLVGSERKGLAHGSYNCAVGVAPCGRA